MSMSIVLACTAAAAAFTQCNQSVTPTLPRIGGGVELAAPEANFALKKIAIGHGIQNYSCVDLTGNFTAAGALAVLYDATCYYPGTAKTGIVQQKWDQIPTHVLWNTPLPLNKLPGSKYGAHPVQPFRAQADLKLPGLATFPFLGHHYFSSAGVPVFDLVVARLRADVKKLYGIDAPSSADRGILDSGAVQWLQLGDAGTGQARGSDMVYRVITAGGGAETCPVAGVGVQSVPYTAFYWFYG
ncbi:hypothetical protein NKR19_g8427 [Coniochaeta hoffmannii]|uniref:Malate dehydrogenase n=1 Tax=Coniochaeta hoffmannii TaxID=91930 RepID=A0AA38VJU6_9PEZI|nr:hypothetical protein NKR19_g8427 [Coniochaeta hoffmannii]